MSAVAAPFSRSERSLLSTTLALLGVMLLLTGCGSGSTRSLDGSPVGGNPPPAPPPPPPPPPSGASEVTVSGRITFDFVPFAEELGQGLDFAATELSPARAVTVEAINSSGSAILASTVTDELGNYTLTLPINTSIRIRVKAEMVRSGAPAWNVRVLNNTNNDALYAITSNAFTTGQANSVRNLNAASGWSVSSNAYTGVRSAAPFAILDVIYEAQTLARSADTLLSFPQLTVFWSPANQSAEGDPDAGEIGTTLFQVLGLNSAAIYVLGAADADTDEFDRHVIAHEWGHYYQWAFSRDDSLGGSHSPVGALDARVAFSEGFADAFSAMVTGDAEYRDSFGSQQGADVGANLESDDLDNPGWFSEGAIAKLIYDLFDSESDVPDADGITLGFVPLHTVMTGPVEDTEAFVTIYPFLEALKTANSTQVPQITALALDKSIRGLGDFATDETNSGGDLDNLPVYHPLVFGGATTITSTRDNGTYNALGNRRFFQMELPVDRTVDIRVEGCAGDEEEDPDIQLYRRGELLFTEEDLGADQLLQPLTAGTYVFEVYESSNIHENEPPLGADACITVQALP